MRTEHVRDILKFECEQAGSAHRWAKAHSINSSNVYSVLRGAVPSREVLAALKLKRVDMAGFFSERDDVAEPAGFEVVTRTFYVKQGRPRNIA